LVQGVGGAHAAGQPRLLSWMTAGVAASDLHF
jgi:hypothetical protein